MARATRDPSEAPLGTRSGRDLGRSHASGISTTAYNYCSAGLSVPDFIGSTSVAMWLPATLLFLLGATPALAQLTGPVGPTTSPSAKRNTICNVLDYGGSIGSSDIGPAIQSAFNNCVLKNKGSTLYVPAGNYNMQTWVTLKGASQWAFQLDGVISRTATTGGHMIVVQNANDFEMYSSNSAGGVQGNGYQCRNAGPRLLRVITSTNFSVHDLIFVDSPEFHIILDNSQSGEVYNLAIRGADIGGSDGIDVSGSNIWIHDVEVTNRDECVTIKNPSSNHLIERIWCNQSGGSAIGSLGTGTTIENIVYRDIYNVGGNQMFMIKSNGGDGYVRNVVFDNFLGLGTAYALDIDGYWSSISTIAGNGVQLTNITFSNWDGYIVDGQRRSAYRILCADNAPCTQINIENVQLWASNNVGTYACRSAYGSGACLKAGSGAGYAQVTQSYSRPAAYSSPPTMAGNLASGFATNSPIPLPTIPTMFFPGLPAISPLAKNVGSPTAPSGPTQTPTSSPTPPPSGGNTGTAAHYAQCGGTGYTGPTTCESPYTCVVSNPYYSQCL